MPKESEATRAKLAGIGDDSEPAMLIAGQIMQSGVDFNDNQIAVIKFHLQNLGSPTATSDAAPQCFPDDDLRTAKTKYNQARSRINAKTARTGIGIISTRENRLFRYHIGIVSQGVNSSLTDQNNQEGGKSKSPEIFNPSPEDSEETVEIKRRLRSASEIQFSHLHLELFQFLFEHPGQKMSRLQIGRHVSPGNYEYMVINTARSLVEGINSRLFAANIGVMIDSHPVDNNQILHSLALVQEQEETEQKETPVDEEEGYWNSPDEELSETSQSRTLDPAAEIAAAYETVFPALSEEDQAAVTKFGIKLATIATTVLKNRGLTKDADSISGLSRDILDSTIPSEEEIKKVRTALLSAPDEQTGKKVVLQAAVLAINAAQDMLESNNFSNRDYFGLMQNCATLERQGVFASEVEVRIVSHFNNN